MIDARRETAIEEAVPNPFNADKRVGNAWSGEARRTQRTGASSGKLVKRHGKKRALLFRSRGESRLRPVARNRHNLEGNR